MVKLSMIISSSSDVLYLVQHLSMTWNDLLKSTLSDHLGFEVKYEFFMVKWHVDNFVPRSR